MYVYVSMYPCLKCNHQFGSKQSLERHEARKVPCTEANAVFEKSCECKYCHKMFQYASNRSRHYKSCKMKPQETEEEYDMDEFLDLMKTLKLSQKKAKMILMNHCTSLTTNSNNNSSNSSNSPINSNNTTINIHINDFGSENLERITDDILHKCFKNYKQHGIQMLTKYIHFNDEYPEDKNIRRGSITNKTLQIRQNGQWTPASKNSVMDKVLFDQIRHLNKYYLDHHDVVDEVEAELFTKWYHAIREKRGEDFFNVREELFVYASSR